MKKYKILHLITALTVGGAEMMLLKIIKETNFDKFDIYVISMKQIGPIGDLIKKEGIKVIALNMTSNILSIKFIFRFKKLLLNIQPDILQTWMYHADFFSLFGKIFYPKLKVIWGIHHSKNSNLKITTRLVIKLCAFLSYFIPNKIFCVSKLGANIHKKIGYKKNKIIVIPNGFCLNTFKPNKIKQEELRNSLNIKITDIIVGTVGRFTKEKDFKTFVQAADKSLKKNPNLKFVMCGRNLTASNKELLAWINQYNLFNNFYLLGEKNNIHDFYLLFDIFVLSSTEEAFPNVVGEAMLCEIPCIVTDVGDVADIVENTAIVVQPKDSSAIANAIINYSLMSNKNRQNIGKIARKRIIDKYSINHITMQYQYHYEDLFMQNN